jgi:hypothetical protein
MKVKLTSVTIGDDQPTFRAYVLRDDKATRRAQASLPLDGDIPFIPQTWNGWTIPYFIEAEADKVMAWVNKGELDNPGETTRIIKKGLVDVAYEIYDSLDPDAPLTVEPSILTLDDKTLVRTWSIGGQSWTWKERT